jgi:hypothetical protein
VAVCEKQKNIDMKKEFSDMPVNVDQESPNIGSAVCTLILMTAFVYIFLVGVMYLLRHVLFHQITKIWLWGGGPAALGIIGVVVWIVYCILAHPKKTKT